MPNADDIRWFKTQFQPRVEAALAGTPLTVDFIAALACQETGEVWPQLRRKGLPVAEVLRLCVGDTLDADRGRAAFPRTRAELLAAPQGAEMFAVARQALLDMAQHISAYAGAAAKPHKFCHGFGLFQRDLQFFLQDPAYFVNRRWERFDDTLEQALHELRRALRKLGFEGRDSLSDLELAAVGIVYNTGGFQPAKGLRQGHFDGSRFYGEALFDYSRLAHTVEVEGAVPLLPPGTDGEAVVSPPSPVTAAGAPMRVKVSEGMLRLRSEPLISDPPQKNVVGHLPDGHLVHRLSPQASQGFFEVETQLQGALLRGFASKKFLVPVVDDQPAPVAPAVPTIPAVHAPAAPGVITRRRALANALSLDEPSQPARSGTTAEALRASLATIVDWLDVENAKHLRYQPRNGLTFCNIYAHDFCHLAGVYLPRVWWTQSALLALGQGRPVEPRLGAMVAEMVANDLFAWLRDFGPTFGWRRTGTLTKLQTEVSQGAVGVIVARRKEAGRPGHIAIVVPEDGDHAALRDATGEVTAPLQSQAGALNFRRGTGKKDWWLAETFADFAFWLHA